MGQRRFRQRLWGFILIASFLAGCDLVKATPVPISSTTPTTGPSITNTPTVDPCTGWWCTVTGVAYSDEAETGKELEGAAVTLAQSSYCSPTSGQYQTATDRNGRFEFGDVFFHDTDKIRIQIESPGHEPIVWDSTDSYCLFCSCFGSPIEFALSSTPGQ